MHNNKILIIGHQARATYIFWSVLIQQMQKAGYEVICCVSKQESDQYINLLQNNNIRVITYSLERKGIKPWQDLKSLAELYKILGHEQPYKIFAFAIKPVIYGNFAARLAGIHDVFSCITGLGFSFEATTNLKKKILQHIAIILYKVALRFSKGIIFQNTADKAVFLQKNIIKADHNILICNGTGVNTKHFALEKNFPKQTTFLLVARLLQAKGIEDFVNAAKILKEKHSNIHFQLLGPLEHGTGAFTLSQVQHWQNLGYIDYLGEAFDVRPYIAAASVVILPSWREGLSCSLMEAMSMGRPIVASDVPGCRELIEEGKNGFLVPPKNVLALANALEKFIINTKLLNPMGAHSRHLAESYFDAHGVAGEILQHMDIK